MTDSLRFDLLLTSLDTSVLPPKMKERLVAELDKRLDLDLDEFLTSPKLRLKLSPAELDRQLLEFYNNISESPGGDILRVIGGGGQIGLQNLYMRRHAEKERWKKLKEGLAPELFASFLDEYGTDEQEGTVSQLVRRSLRTNLSKIGSANAVHLQATNNGLSRKKKNQNDNTPTMCCIKESTMAPGLHTWTGFRPSDNLYMRRPTRSVTSRFSILI